MERIVTDAELSRLVPAHFLSKVSPEPNTGCWLWAAAWNTTGYANFWHDGKCQTGHRFIYERLYGPQVGLEIDHLCRVPCCVNPAHLEAVSARTNNDRRIGLGSANRRKTHCIKGHALEGSNLEIVPTKDGKQKRRCIICRNANQRAYNARRAAARGR